MMFLLMKMLTITIIITRIKIIYKEIHKMFKRPIIKLILTTILLINNKLMVILIFHDLLNRKIFNKLFMREYNN